MKKFSDCNCWTTFTLLFKTLLVSCTDIMSLSSGEKTLVLALVVSMNIIHLSGCPSAYHTFIWDDSLSRFKDTILVFCIWIPDDYKDTYSFLVNLSKVKVTSHRKHQSQWIWAPLVSCQCQTKRHKKKMIASLPNTRHLEIRVMVLDETLKSEVLCCGRHWQVQEPSLLWL